MNPAKKIPGLLIVDDNPHDITMAGQILSRLDVSIRIAADGETALRLIDEQKPSLILLDVQMNGLSGFELCTRLKQSEEYRDIAVIFMTGSGDEESIRRGFELGALDYVVKPYHASELLARVSTHLKLKSSYEELDCFTHTVSHDLKSPLQVIQQLAGLAETEIPLGNTQDLAEILNRLNQKSAQVIEMVDRLLEFSRIGTSSLHFTTVDLTEIFEKQLADFKILYPNRSLSIKMGQLPVISGDLSLLNLLIQNILSNACKFSRHRPLTLLTIEGDTDSDTIQIKVTDNGSGFDMKYAANLFGVFERLHTDEEFEGTGVGLSICKRIMERHGGTITIAGEPDAGTCVTLTFRH